MARQNVERRGRGTALTLAQRTAVFFVYLAAIYAIKGIFVDGWRLTADSSDLWYFSLAGLLGFKLLSNPFFVPPSEALASSLAAGLVLVTLKTSSVPPAIVPILELTRYVGIAVLAIATMAAIIATLLKDADVASSPRRHLLGRVAYRASERLGRSEVAFTFPALISVLGFHSDRPASIALLLIGWVLLVVVEPLESFLRVRNEVAELGAEQANLVGRIQRVDSPNLIRVVVKDAGAWDRAAVHVATLASGEQKYILPLFYQIQDVDLVGTGLCAGNVDPQLGGLAAGTVVAPQNVPTRRNLIARITGVNDVDLVGFIVEGSTIASIRFEAAAEAGLREGAVVLTRVPSGETVYYQILDASTTEETFTSNPRGTHVVVGAQLGTLNAGGGFCKYPWVPEMNAPMFLRTAALATEVQLGPGDMVLGQVPGTNMPVIANFNDIVEFHAAILGVTGTGKTELAFDIIREAMKNDTKVFCVDFTGEYRLRLAEHEPIELALSEKEVKDIAEAATAVEVGKYGGTDEKKALHELLGKLQPAVDKKVAEFLVADGAAVGVFELPDLANTRATLRATELYVSSIFEWARRHRRARKILIVLEEAHTVIPEFNLFSRDKSETDAVVGRMAQIVLQGRKYGVGLLLISQRTALVSKTLLSQCNTCFTFTLVDKTSLDYLANFYSPEHVRAIPNLLARQTMAFGKAVRSERPILVELPFDQKKKLASEALTVPLNVPIAAPQEVPMAEDPPAAGPDDNDDELPF